MQHIIIIVNPMVALYLLHLIESVYKSEDQIKIVEFYQKPLLNSKQKQQLHEKYSDYVKIESYICKPYSFGYFFHLRKELKKLRELDSMGGRACFYIAQPNHILTNYVYFSLNGSDRIDIHLIPDGIANYYAVSVSSYKKKMILKKIYSLALGFNYKMYYGDYLGIDYGIYKSVYYLNIKSKYIPKFWNQIKINMPITIPNKSGVDLLILGQDVAKGSEDLYLKIVSLILKINNSFRIDYRPHPAEIVNKELEKLFEKNNVKILKNTGIAENITCKYAKCVGFLSSALFNTALLCGNWVRIESYYGDFIKDFIPMLTDKSIIELNHLFAKVGIKVTIIDE